MNKVLNFVSSGARSEFNAVAASGILMLISANQMKITKSLTLAIATVFLVLLLSGHNRLFSQEHPGCFMLDNQGVFIDLSTICPAPEPVTEEPVLGTGDVQVTLKWATIDDLDLSVIDPSGDEVLYSNPRVASGGELDVDSNASCSETTRNPVENVFWPIGGAPTGNYVAKVTFFARCQQSVQEVEFNVSLLVKGNRTESTGKVNVENDTVTFPFSL